MALAAAALALPLRQFTDQDYLDPPWQHDLDSGLWHARRGSLPGRWDARQANPPPPPVTSPPPWWAVGVGGDGEYDWNLRARDYEYSGLVRNGKDVRGLVAGITSGCAKPCHTQLRLYGVSSQGRHTHRERPAGCLGSHRTTCECPPWPVACPTVHMRGRKVAVGRALAGPC